MVAVAALLVACARGGTQTSPTATPTRSADPTLVRTTSGVVRGAFAADHLLFAGVPYAAPPVGPLRFQPPAPPSPWQGVRDASKFGPRCMQETEHDPDFGRPVSEDCLTLNVWTPNRPADRQLPVLVWIHGGAFVNGSADIYDARWLADQGDITVVTVNYRLGALGFLAHPSLAPRGQAGNYGLADQQAALRWIHDNIANFGGDPAKVTIAGESAGAMSVCDHLVAPGSVGLFRAAIIQSGPCQAQADLATAQHVSLDYAASVGCGDPATAAECLRALPSSQLDRPPWYYHVGTDGLTGPVTGTLQLPVNPITAAAQGRAARVPVLIGTTHDEFTLFVATQYMQLGRMPDYPSVLNDTFGPIAAQIATRYPVDRYGGDAALAYAAAVTDGVFACPTDRLAGSLTQSAPVYGYEFNDRNAPAPDPLRNVPFPVGASHSLELRYLFDIGWAPPLDPAQQHLSDEMIRYWARFVATGAPQVDGQPSWPPLGHTMADAPRMSLQTPEAHTFTDYDEAHQCAFWASVPLQSR
ncbi:MAG: carboxylesterase family protein [Mycobacteriaceae bacterium]|nr:carboxylesterase family protein [Mycobacteriaceae bacterium]